MTRTAERLGEILDQPPTVHLWLQYGSGMAERDVLPSIEDEARQQNDDRLAMELAWERGIMDLNPLRMPEADLFPPDRESYVSFYGLTDETRVYALQRVEETRNPVLRVHHLAYARATIPQTGREWVALTRRLAVALQEYVDFVVSHLATGADGADAVPLIEVLPLLVHLVNLPGVFPPSEREQWTAWLVALAQQLRDHDWSEGDYNRPHRWPFEVVRHLTAFPSRFVRDRERSAALHLVDEAFTFFSAEPLASTLAAKAAETDHELRRHFGEQNTHELMTRRTVEALNRHAAFFEEHGHTLGAALVVRDATKVMNTHGQHFDDAERTAAQGKERNLLAAAVASGEFKAVATIHFDMTPFDFTGETAADTVANLARDSLSWLPSPDDIRVAVDAATIEHPLAGMLPATTVSEDRVVAEALTEEQRRAAGAARYFTVQGEAVGTLVSATLTNAAASQSLQAEHVMRALDAVPFVAESVPVVRRGVRALLDGDSIAAVYILAPLVEEAVRRVLRAAGFETSVFRMLDSSSGASRTDDAALGDLLRLQQDGKSAEDVLGASLIQYIAATTSGQIGPNLRNKTAHGLTRAHDCSPAHAGLLLHILVCLASVAAPASGTPADP